MNTDKQNNSTDSKPVPIALKGEKVTYDPSSLREQARLGLIGIQEAMAQRAASLESKEQDLKSTNTDSKAQKARPVYDPSFLREQAKRGLAGGRAAMARRANQPK